MLLLLTTALAKGAENAGHPEPSASGQVLIALMIVGIAYLTAHFVVNRLQRRLLFVSGAEYILLGLLLGPAGAGALAVFDNLGSVAPVIAFAAGWVGLLYGMELNIRSLLDDDRGLAMRLAFAEVLGTGTAVTACAYLFFTSGLMIEPVGTWEALAAGGAMGSAAAAGSSSAVDLLEDSYPTLQSRLLPLLRHTARIGDLLAILTLGLLFSVFHGGTHHDPSVAVTSQWILATVGIGLGLGIVFSLFLGDDATPNARFLALVGIIVFAAGAAFFLHISALTVNLMLGAALVNTSDGPKVRETLESSMKPVVLVLMVVAGAMWAPVDFRAAAVASVGYILIRALAKAVSLGLATLGQPVRRDVFRGMMAQGDTAVAIAVSFRLVYDGPAADLAYCSILISVMTHELVAPRLLKGLLIDASELDDDAAWSPS